MENPGSDLALLGDDDWAGRSFLLVRILLFELFRSLCKEGDRPVIVSHAAGALDDLILVSNYDIVY